MADISQIKLPNNTVLDLKDATAREALADMSKVHVIELESQETIDDDSVYISEVTNNEVKTMVDNGELVVLKLGKSFFYFYGYDRSVAWLTFFGGEERDRLIRPYQYNNTYTNYWCIINEPQIYQVNFAYVEVEGDNEESTLEWQCNKSITDIMQAYNAGQLVIGHMQYYSQQFTTTKIVLDSLDGYNMYFHFEDNNFIYVLSLSNASSTIYFSTIYIPEPESDENVSFMLTEMGLSTTAYFNQATVGTAEPEHSIVQDTTQ